MKRFNFILLVIIILLLALFEREEQISITTIKMMGGKVSTFRNLLIFILFVLSVVGSSYQRRPKIQMANFFFFFVIYMSVSYIFMQFRAASFNEFLIMSASILLPINIFLCFYKAAHIIPEKHFVILIALSFCIMLEGYLETYQMNLINSLTEETVNTGYVFLYFLPFFLVARNNRVKMLGLLFVLAITIISLKRGGIVAIALGVIVYYLTEMVCSNRKFKMKTLFLFFFLVVTSYVASITFMDKYIDDMFVRFNDISEDQGSSRYDIFEVTWGMIEKSDSQDLLFGHGYNSVIKKSPLGFSAHNDFLEIIYDFGIIGSCIYVFFIFYVIKTILRMIKRRSLYAPAFVFSFVVLITQSMVSHIAIYPMYLIAFAAVWGYILGKEGMDAKTIRIK